MAEVEAESISYIEAHGTATELGDPIEVEALTKSFRSTTDKKGFCGIGSVKSNMGHLSAAAGVTGLIKTVLSLKNKTIPPSLHFENPNPQIDFENSPFYVNSEVSEWELGQTPRRAGVSSFGMGGTNAHAVVEEAPPLEASGLSRAWQLLVLSARTKAALDNATLNLKKHLTEHPEINLADVAFTLQVGRRCFNHQPQPFWHKHLHQNLRPLRSVVLATYRGNSRWKEAGFPACSQRYFLRRRQQVYGNLLPPSAGLFQGQEILHHYVFPKTVGPCLPEPSLKFQPPCRPRRFRSPAL